MHALAGKLGVTVVELTDAIREVGTWIPAIERKFSAAAFYTANAKR
jgi:hypothetical protein